MKLLTEPLVIVSIIAVVLAPMGLLPGYIVAKRRLRKESLVRALGLWGFVAIVFGTIYASTFGVRVGSEFFVLTIGIAPGLLLWLTALIWACIGKTEYTGTGFEIR